MDKKTLSEREKLKLEIKIRAKEIEELEAKMLKSCVADMIAIQRQLNNLKIKHQALCQRLNPPKYDGISHPDIIIINR